MKHNAASSNFVQPTTILALMMVAVASQAGPAPGYADLVPPGTWSERWTADYRVFEMGDGATYKVDAFSPCLEYVDGTGHWEWIREYGNATIWLNNIPGTAWYSPSDTNLDFVLSSRALTLKLRNPAGASTNPYAAYLEMEVSTHAGNALLLATYAGHPAVTNVPETPDEVGYTLATGGLASARLAVSLPDQIAGAAGLGIRVVATPGSAIELFWNSASNRLYQVQHCVNLSTGNWTDSGSPLVGIGTTLQARQTIIPGEPQALYRVLEYPGLLEIQGPFNAPSSRTPP